MFHVPIQTFETPRWTLFLSATSPSMITLPNPSTS